MKRQAGRPGTTKRYMISPFVKKSVALGARRGPARPPGLPGPVLGSGTEGCGAAVACVKGVSQSVRLPKRML